MSYPENILSTRVVVKPGKYAVLPEDALVNNVIPSIKNCRVSIVASPKMGASFVEYIITAQPGGYSTKHLANEDGIESFLYCIEGDIECGVGLDTYNLTSGGYIFAPSDTGIKFKCEKEAKILFYKQRYIPLAGGEKPYICVGNVNEMEYQEYEGMKNVFIKDLLPKDLAFDMNMHILSFNPGGCHSFIETHVQEHGAYILSGEGMYYMEDKWMPIKKNDFMWFGPYVAQGCYGIGREPFAYIYSKDCNRDVEL